MLRTAAEYWGDVSSICAWRGDAAKLGEGLHPADLVAELGGFFVTLGFDRFVQLMLQASERVHGNFAADFAGELLQDADLVGFGEGFVLAESGKKSRMLSMPFSTTDRAGLKSLLL